MMFRKLQKFLKENECKLLIKYDGERVNNKYTIRTLYSNICKKSLGKDTDSPREVLNYILSNNSFSDKGIDEEFMDIINEWIMSAKNIMGNKCILSIVIEEMNEKLLFKAHFQLGSLTKHTSSENIDDITKFCNSIR